MANYDDRDRGFLHTNASRSERGPTWRCSEIEISRELLTALIAEARAGRKPLIEIAGWDGTTKAGKPYVSIKLSLRAPQAGQRMGGDRGEYEPHRGPVTRERREQLPPREVPQPVRQAPEWERAQRTDYNPQQGRPTTTSRPAHNPWDDEPAKGDMLDDPLPEGWK